MGSIRFIFAHDVLLAQHRTRDRVDSVVQVDPVHFQKTDVPVSYQEYESVIITPFIDICIYIYMVHCDPIYNHKIPVKQLVSRALSALQMARCLETSQELGRPNHTGLGPQSIVFNWFITSSTMVYGGYNIYRFIYI